MCGVPHKLWSHPFIVGVSFVISKHTTSMSSWVMKKVLWLEFEKRELRPLIRICLSKLVGQLQ